MELANYRFRGRRPDGKRWLYGALFAGLGLLVGLGRLFLWLGDRLDRLGRA